MKYPQDQSKENIETIINRVTPLLNFVDPQPYKILGLHYPSDSFSDYDRYMVPFSTKELEVLLSYPDSELFKSQKHFISLNMIKYLKGLIKSFVTSYSPEKFTAVGQCNTNSLVTDFNSECRKFYGMVYDYKQLGIIIDINEFSSIVKCNQLFEYLNHIINILIIITDIDKEKDFFVKHLSTLFFKKDYSTDSDEFFKLLKDLQELFK